jgi:hypothetical protein
MMSSRQWKMEDRQLTTSMQNGQPTIESRPTASVIAQLSVVSLLFSIARAPKATEVIP